MHFAFRNQFVIEFEFSQLSLIYPDSRRSRDRVTMNGIGATFYRPQDLGIRLFEGMPGQVPEAQRAYLHSDYVPLRGDAQTPDIFALFNVPFYRRGPTVFGDIFTTKVSHNPLAAQADAREFVESIDRQKPKISFSVVEWGIGNGRYALDFLDEVQRLDPILYGMLTYWAVDGSDEMLANLKAILPWESKHRDRLRFIDCNPHDPFPAAIRQLRNVKLIRFNEFYDDLRATEIAFHGGKFYELWVRLYLCPEKNLLGGNSGEYLGLLESVFSRTSPPPDREKLTKAAQDPDRKIFGGSREFFPYLYADPIFAEIDPKQYPFGHLFDTIGKANSGSSFPLNLAAYEHFRGCLDLLRASNGYMRFNDYGGRSSLLASFYAVAKLQQLTGPINWAHLKTLALREGFQFLLEPQQAHVSRWHKRHYIDPRIFNHSDFAGHLIGCAGKRGAKTDEGRLHKTLSDFSDAWWRGGGWAEADSFLLTPTREEQELFMRPQIEELLANFGRQDARKTLDKLSPLQIDLRYIIYLLQGFPFQPSVSYCEMDQDPEMELGVCHRAELMQSLRKENRHRSAVDFIRAMHQLFGASWRGRLKQAIEKAPASASVLTAKVS